MSEGGTLNLVRTRTAYGQMSHKIGQFQNRTKTFSTSKYEKLTHTATRYLLTSSGSNYNILTVLTVMINQTFVSTSLAALS